MRGLPGRLVRFLTDVHPIRNERDAENYIARLSQVQQGLAHAVSEPVSGDANQKGHALWCKHLLKCIQNAQCNWRTQCSNSPDKP
jgi:hypothetical protein